MKLPVPTNPVRLAGLAHSADVATGHNCPAAVRRCLVLGAFSAAEIDQRCELAAATRNNQRRADKGLLARLQQIPFVAVHVDGIRRDLILFGDALDCIAFGHGVNNAVNGRNRQIHPWLQEVGIIFQGVVVGPQDALWPQAELAGNTKEGVARLNRIGDDAAPLAAGNGRIGVGLWHDDDLIDEDGAALSRKVIVSRHYRWMKWAGSLPRSIHGG